MRLIKEIEKKSVLILGLGREGKSTFAFLRKHFPDKVLGLADYLSWKELDRETQRVIKKEKRITLHLGDDYLKALGQYDIIFKSPGIYPPELKEARKAGKRISSNTELFFDCCPGITIGVTGTKGKSTTASLIYEVLREGRLDVRLGGNIGVPPLSSLRDNVSSNTIFILELSSYQLMDLKRSPHIAILQGMTQEHLDYHGSFKAYLRAKQKITQYQDKTDYLLFNVSSSFSRKIAKRSKARKIPFGLTPKGGAVYFVEGGSFVFSSKERREQIIPITSVPLKGRFNLQNVIPAIIIGKIFGISKRVIKIAVKNFKPLKHRLDFVGTYRGISFYNDSLSTIPEATIEAMSVFSGKNLILLLGGYDRGQDFQELAQKILINKVRALILFPGTGRRIWNALLLRVRDAGNITLPKHVFVTKMKEAVQEVYKLAKKGDVVLLSPASASFGIFRDYADRGNQFKREVKKQFSFP